MRLTIDLNKLQLVNSPTDLKAVTLLEFKRGDVTPIELVFARDGVAVAMDEDIVITFGLKAKDKFDGAFVVATDDFDGPADVTLAYTGSPNFSTAALDTLLFVDSDLTNDIPQVDLMGEISWDIGGVNPVSIKTFVARVANDVIRGDETAPAGGLTRVDWLAAHGIVFDPSISGLTGGGSTKLDGLATAGVATGRLQAIHQAGNLSIYRLQAGTNATSSPTVIRPTDYAGGTNEKFWLLMGLFAGSFSASFASFGELNVEETIEVGLQGQTQGQIIFYETETGFKVTVQSAIDLPADVAIGWGTVNGTVLTSNVLAANDGAAATAGVGVGEPYIVTSTGKTKIRMA